MTFRSLIKKSEGVISLFMAIVMLATFVMSGVIVEGSRLRQAEAIIQSAADSAAMSVLAKYDIELYDRYGLFVMDSQSKEDIQQDFIDFFMANLSASLPDEDSLSDIFTRLEVEYGIKKGVDDLFDMYDFQADEINVDPVYSVGAPQILQLQTTEVSKYRSVFILLQDIANMGDTISESAQQQQKDIEVMQQSLQYREQAQGITEKLVQFTESLYQFYDGGQGQGNDKGRKLRADYDGYISSIDTAFSELKTAYEDASNKFTKINTAIGEYNTAAQTIAQKEEQLMEDKAGIQFDSTSDDYDESKVNEWNEDAAEIDTAVADLKNNKLKAVNNAITNYNNAVNNANTKNENLKRAISNLNSYLSGLKTTLNEYLSYYNNTLKGEIESAINSAKDHKTYLTSSGGSPDVVGGAESDANIVLESLENALDAKIDERLGKTISHVDSLTSALNTFSGVYSNIKFTFPRVSGITYQSSDGTIAALQSAADAINAAKEPEDEAVRPEWDLLSDIDTVTGSVSVDPSNAFTNYTNAVKGIKKINGKAPFPSGTDIVDYYMYDVGNNVDTQFGESDSERSSAVGTLKNMYEQGEKSSESTLQGEPNGDISDIASSLPSNNRGNFSLADTFAADDNAYATDFVNRYKEASVVDPGDAGGLDGGNAQQLNGLSGLSFGKDAGSQSGALSILNGFMDSVVSYFNSKQYDIMTYVYTMSMFKNRLTKDPAEWKELYDNQATDPRALGNKKFYVERDNEDADLNLMFDHLASDDLATRLNCELEYILRGKNTDKQNRDEVWAIIYGLRMGNNLIAVYSNSELRNAAASAAQAIAAAIASVTFGLGSALAPIIQFALIALMAALETYWDMVFLVNMGYKVPFIKTSRNLNLSLENLAGGTVDAPNSGTGDFMVKYEDYLLIFMLFTKQEDVLFRSADLIQMNMQLETGDSSYDLSKRFTYLRYKSKVSIKPLMISYAFMPDDIRRDDRRLFTTLAYQGY